MAIQIHNYDLHPNFSERTTFTGAFSVPVASGVDTADADDGRVVFIMPSGRLMVGSGTSWVGVNLS